MHKFTEEECKRLAFAISLIVTLETQSNSTSTYKIQIRLYQKDNPFVLITNGNEIDEDVLSTNTKIFNNFDKYLIEDPKHKYRFTEEKRSRTFRKGANIYFELFHMNYDETLSISDLLIFLLLDLPSDLLDKILRITYSHWETNRLDIKSARTLLHTLFKENKSLTNNQKQDIIELFSGFSNVILDKILEIHLDEQTNSRISKINLIKISALLKLSQSLEYDFSSHLSGTSMKSYPFAHYKEFPYIASAMTIYNDWINISVRDIQSFGIVIHALNQVIEEHDNLDDLFNPLADSKFNPNNWVPIFEFLHDGIKERCHQELLQSQKNEDITSTYIHMEWSFPSEIFTPFVSTLTFSSIDQVTSLFEFLRNNQLLNGMADYAIQFMVDKQIEKKSH